jgi:hypothetical protein
MKTIFKVGMKVYDSVFFPKLEGKVIKIEKRLNSEIVIVQFDCLGHEFSYTKQGILTSTPIGDTPTLSTSPYTFQGFEQKESVPTYKEAIKWIDEKHKDKAVYEDELYFEADALKKLITLRDYYNEGWQPDWKSNTSKFTIEICNEEFQANKSIYQSRVMVFRVKEVRDKFLEEQRELLEIAKPLL